MKDVQQRLKTLSLRSGERSFSSLWRTQVLSACFELTVTHCNIKYATLGGDGKPLDGQTRTQSISWEDVLGLHFTNNQGELVDQAPGAGEGKLGLFSCIKTKTQARKLMATFLQIPSSTTQEDLETLVLWVNWMADSRHKDTIDNASSLSDLVDHVQKTDKRKFYVVINPKGGSGKGVHKFQTHVAPMFKLANIDVETKLTDHAGHASDIMQSIPLNTYDCIVSVGGDGSLYEMYQGLMRHADSKSAIKQPLAVVPTGSGNGLASSLLYPHDNHFPKLINFAYMIAKGRPRPIDITTIKTNQDGGAGSTNPPLYSFLSIEWGMIADVDIESEGLRYLGGARFGIKFFDLAMFRNRMYYGSISYLDEKLSSNLPSANSSDDLSDTSLVDAFESKHEKKENMDYSKNETNETYQTKLPDGNVWTTVRGKFRMIWGMNVAYAATDAFVAPNALKDDGLYHLLLVDGAVTKAQLVSLLLKLDHGGHLEDSQKARIVTTRAFVLEVEDEGDIICVDGESVKGPKLQGQVHAGLGRIIDL